MRRRGDDRRFQTPFPEYLLDVEEIPPREHIQHLLDAAGWTYVDFLRQRVQRRRDQLVRAPAASSRPLHRPPEPAVVSAPAEPQRPPHPTTRPDGTPLRSRDW